MRFTGSFSLVVLLGRVEPRTMQVWTLLFYQQCKCGRCYSTNNASVDVVILPTMQVVQFFHHKQMTAVICVLFNPRVAKGIQAGLEQYIVANHTDAVSWIVPYSRRRSRQAIDLLFYRFASRPFLNGHFVAGYLLSV